MARGGRKSREHEWRVQLVIGSRAGRVGQQEE